MKNYGWLILASLILASAAPPRVAEDLVRAGNAAFHAENYDLALDCYTQAEERITDPGLVAFNKAAAYYRLGQYRSAELHYVRTLEGATGERRAVVLYDLANSVLKQAQESKDDVKLFDRAIGFYKTCLAEPAASDALREDAKHNLQLAQAQRALARPREEPEREKNPDDKSKQEDDKKQPETATGTESPGVQEDPNGKVQQVGEKDKIKEAKPSRRPSPGTGKLPPIPDEDEPKPMPPEEAAENLRRAAERILAERKQLRRAPPANSRNLLNW